jgi:hypothetical protein
LRVWSVDINSIPSFLGRRDYKSPPFPLNCIGSLFHLNLSVCYVSSANLVKIAEFCLELEQLTLSYKNEGLSESDMKVIAFLPHLNRLEISCNITEEAVSSMNRCRELNHFQIIWQMASGEMSIKGIDAIVEYCPNLQYLAVTVKENDELSVEMINQGFRVKEIGESKSKLCVCSFGNRLGKILKLGLV